MVVFQSFPMWLYRCMICMFRFFILLTWNIQKMYGRDCPLPLYSTNKWNYLSFLFFLKSFCVILWSISSIILHAVVLYFLWTASLTHYIRSMFSSFLIQHDSVCLIFAYHIATICSQYLIQITWWCQIKTSSLLPLMNNKKIYHYLLVLKIKETKHR